MKSRPKLDLDKIAAGLGAERGGPVRTESGAFGAAQLAADITARMRTPATGGRPSDPALTEKRLVAMTPTTLAALGEIAGAVRGKTGLEVGPLQVASVLLEQAVAAADAAGKDGGNG